MFIVINVHTRNFMLRLKGPICLLYCQLWRLQVFIQNILPTCVALNCVFLLEHIAYGARFNMQ
jgi:hypothetical protein